MSLKKLIASSLILGSLLFSDNSYGAGKHFQGKNNKIEIKAEPHWDDFWNALEKKFKDPDFAREYEEYQRINGFYRPSSYEEDFRDSLRNR